jgi:hypothetical protein
MEGRSKQSFQKKCRFREQPDDQPLARQGISSHMPPDWLNVTWRRTGTP